MAQIDILSAQVAALTEAFNAMNANARKTSEFPLQDPLILESLIRIEELGVSKHITIDQLISKATSFLTNELLYFSGTTIVGNTVTLLTGSVWKIDGVIYSNTSIKEFIVPYTSDAGLVRIDLLVGDNTNDVTRIQGDESDIAIIPTYSNDEVIICNIKVSDSNIEIVTIIPENIANKQNDLSYDGTGEKYTAVDGVNEALLRDAKMFYGTGITSKNDGFELVALDVNTVRIKAVDNACFYNELFDINAVTADAFRSFPQIDYPLSELVTATSGNINANPITTDGVFVRYLGYDESGNVVSSESSFVNNNSVVQLGYVSVINSAGTVSFVGGATPGGRNVFSQPILAVTNDLQRVRIVPTTDITVDHNVGSPSLKSNAGTITGISINWRGLSNPSNTSPIDKVNYAGDSVVDFVSLTPDFLTQTTPPSIHTLWTETEGGIAINNSFWNTTSSARGTLNNNAFSIKRVLIGLRGGIFVQEGEHATSAGYSSLSDAQSNIYTHQFTDSIIPPGVVIEIARIAFKKGVTDFSDSTQFYIAVTSGSAGSGGGIASVPDATTASKGIVKLANEIGGTADLPTVDQKLKTAIVPTVAVGGISIGETQAIGTSIDSLLREMLAPYVNPVFTSFSISGQATTIEVGTTLSGSKTFTWAITVNSGVISTIDIYDNTAAATLLAGTPNDGTQAQTITSIQLNTDGATQSWKGIGNNTSPIGTINSSNFVVTSRFLRWHGSAITPPNPANTSAQNRAYFNSILSSAFKTSGTNTFTLVTGTTATNFYIVLPPGVTLVSVIDQTNAGVNITADYVLSTLQVDDAGATSRTYNVYKLTTAIPYSTSASHAITTT